MNRSGRFLRPEHPAGPVPSTQPDPFQIIKIIERMPPRFILVKALPIAGSKLRSIETMKTRVRAGTV